jgi:hypothetical protein
MFSNRWIVFADIQKALADWPDDLPITSMTLRPLLPGSINTSSFLLATLVNEGVLQQVPDKKRLRRGVRVWPCANSQVGSS